MAGTEGTSREFRVVSSRIDLDDVSGRVLFPSPLQGPWLPFQRFADTITTGGGDDTEGHTHQEEEVLNYVIEGRVDYEDDAGHRSVLEPGSVELLTAREETSHKLMGLKPGPRTRWVSVVVRCPPSIGASAHRFQVASGPAPIQSGKAALVRFLVGPDAPVASGCGLECIEIGFRTHGRCVCPVGPQRRAVAYVFDGSGSLDNQLLEVGVGALMENVTQVTIQAKSGTRLLLASVPRALV
ncbi:MAG: pirin family protein [Thermoplasmata archaeon]